MRMTAKEIDLAEKYSDDFFEDMDGQELAVVGLTVLMISAGFILRVASNKDEAIAGMDSLMKDIEASIEETFSDSDSSLN